MHQIPLTIFDLVEPKSLHKLYGMLALALDEDSFFDEDTTAAKANVSSADTSASSRLSIILPAKKFRQANNRYEVTVSRVRCHHAHRFIVAVLHYSLMQCFTLVNVQIIFMDLAPTERNFVGWITPVPLSKYPQSDSTVSSYSCALFSSGKKHNSKSPPPTNQIARGTILCLKESFLCQLLGGAAM
jgi:hypothetical protein